MAVFEELRSALRRQYDDGLTQQEIADRTGISRPLKARTWLSTPPRRSDKPKFKGKFPFRKG